MRTTVTVPFTISGGVPSLPPSYSTPWDTFTNYAANPNLWTVRSGQASDGSVWNLGRPPASGDTVAVLNDLQYDRVSNAAVRAIGVFPGGRLSWRPDGFTFLNVQTLLVAPGGVAECGTPANPIQCDPTSTHFLGAETVFTDTPTTDPWSNGIVCLGKMTVCGMDKGPVFIRLAADALAGQNTLTLSQPATGWRVGDVVILPDTRQVTYQWDGSGLGSYQSHVEKAVITAISADGLTLTINVFTGITVTPGAGPDGSIGTAPVYVGPLQYDHKGSRNEDGTLFRMPHVAVLTRSVLFRSERHTGVRGHTLFTYRAEVDIQNVAFHALGRLSSADAKSDTPPEALPLNFRHLMGPATPTNPWQFRFQGCSVLDNEFPSTHLWPIFLRDSHYGLIKNNAVFNWQGAGFLTRDPQSSYNTFDSNIAIVIDGNGVTLNNVYAGQAYWFANPTNRCVNNVAASVGLASPGLFTYTFMFDFANYNWSTGSFRASAVVALPAFQGADTSIPAQTVTANLHALPLTQVDNNEMYGCMRGYSWMWVGTNYQTPAGNAGTISNSVLWHIGAYGDFPYESNNLVIDGWTMRQDLATLPISAYNNTTGLFFGDYMTRGCVLRNVDVEGCAYGVSFPTNVGKSGYGYTDPGTFALDSNIRLKCAVNLRVPDLFSTNGGATLLPRIINVNPLTWEHTPPSPPGEEWKYLTQYDVSMDEWWLGTDPYMDNRTQTTTVNVYGYQGQNLHTWFTYNAPQGATTMSGIRSFVTSF